MTRSAARKNNPAPEKGRVRRWLADRAFVVCLVIAAVAHLPATPFARVVGNWLDFVGDAPKDDEVDAEIPMEIDIGADIPDQAPEIKPQPKAEEPPKPPEPEPPPAMPEPLPPVATEAPPPPPPKPKRESPADKIQDVRALAKNPNHVTIVLVGEELRKHPIGSKMGGLLSENRGWEHFFKDTSIDPVADIDVMVLTGPQMRMSGNVIAIMKFSADMDRVKAAVDQMVKKGKSRGRWLKDAPVAAARVIADGNERIFALVPEDQLLYVFPSPYPDKAARKILKKEGKLKEAMAKSEKDVFKALEKVKKGTFKDQKTPPYAIEAYMVEPWKLPGKDGKIKLPVVGEVELIPKSLDQARIVVVPQGADADITITLVSNTPAQAIEDAKSLTGTWGLIKVAASVKYDLKLPDMEFKPDGNKIVGTARLDQAALQRAFDIGLDETNEAKKEKGKDDDLDDD